LTFFLGQPCSLVSCLFLLPPPRVFPRYRLRYGEIFKALFSPPLLALFFFFLPSSPFLRRPPPPRPPCRCRPPLSDLKMVKCRNGHHLGACSCFFLPVVFVLRERVPFLPLLRISLTLVFVPKKSFLKGDPFREVLGGRPFFRLIHFPLRTHETTSSNAHHYVTPPPEEIYFTLRVRSMSSSLFPSYPQSPITPHFPPPVAPSPYPEFLWLSAFPLFPK